MKIKSGKGTGGIIVAKKNREKVRKYFLDNPNHTIAECARALYLTWPTVKGHVVEIKKGDGYGVS